jgi:hypothetical protein
VEAFEKSRIMWSSMSLLAADPVKNLLLQIKDCLVLKKRQANLVLEILEQKETDSIERLTFLKFVN